MSDAEESRSTSTDYAIADVMEQLEELEETVDSSDERREVRRAKRMLEHVPGEKHIRKYTSRDIAEGFVGGIVFSLPLLVEDGVFEIAEWFTTITVGPIPVFFILNALFVISLVGGLLYYTDIREVQMRAFFGVIPKRLVAILAISFVVAAMTMLMWGRLHEEDPTAIEALARITVIWAAAALGATLGDILPGESRGEDLSQLVAERADARERERQK